MMNKKIAGILLILIFTGLYLFAQEGDEKHLKYDAKDWGVGFQIDGLLRDIRLTSFSDDHATPVIQIRKFIDDRWAVRGDFGINVVNHQANITDSLDTFRRDYDSTYSRTDWFFAPAIEYHFEGTRRLDPYLGLGLRLSRKGRETQNASTDLQDTIGTANVTRNYDMPGGFSFGVNLMAGFNFFVAPKLALGAEYHVGFTRMTSGGDFDIVTINRPITGAQTTSRNRGSNRVSNNNLATSSSVSVSLSYFFNKQKDKTN